MYVKGRRDGVRRIQCSPGAEGKKMKGDSVAVIPNKYWPNR